MKSETLISVLFDLLAEEIVTAPQVAEKYGVSERSAYRYMDALSLANVPVYSER